MTLAAYLSMIGVNFIGMASPGPDIFLALRLATKSRKHALAAVFGVSVGATMWLLLTVFGLAALLRAVPSLMAVIQLLGGLYLLYTGFSLLRGGIKVLRDINAGAIAVVSAESLGSPWKYFRQGLFTNLSNPKIVLFLAAVLSQFIPTDAPLWVLVLCIVTLVITQVLFFCTIAIVVSTEAVVKRMVMAGPWIDIVAGVLFTVMSVIFINSGVHALL